MGASLIISVFLAFSLSLSWFSGDKEKAMLSDTIEETRAEQEAINQSYQYLTVKMRAKEAKQRTLEGKLEKERKKQKKLKRELALEQRKMRMAVESGTAVDLENEREKIRKEVEDRASKEIAKLEAKILTIEQEKIRLEENARIGLTARHENNGNGEGDGWAQAELAKSRAREAIAQYKALKTELDELRAAKETAVDERLQMSKAEREQKAEEKALVEEKAKRAALKTRLIATERALRAAEPATTSKEEAETASAGVLVTELDKASRMLRRKITLRDKTISELEQRIHSAKNIINNDEQEKQALRSALENKARRIAELEAALNASKTREESLRANLNGTNENTITTERASDPVDKERVDTLRARILSLQAKLQEVEDKKKVFAEQARAKIEELRKKTQLLETKNLDMEKGLKAGAPLKAKVLKENEPLKARALKENQPLKAEALKENKPLKAEVFDEHMPLKARATEYGAPLKAGVLLPDETPGLQTKAGDTGLVDLQTQATSYLAQKMIDRNVELEAQLQDTRLQLAEAQSAYRDANAGFSGNRQFSPGREDTRAIIARYRKAATTITTLNQRNVELEARAGETARALAQAEAARFIIEKLQARNLELEEKFQRLKKAAAYNEKEPAPVEALSIEAAESITAPREEPFVETTTEMAIAETAPLSVEAASNETVAAESLPEDEMMPDTTVIPESAPEESAALPAPADTGDEKEAMSSETILTPPDKAPAPEGPMMLASLEKKTSSQEMIESATPAITASTHDAAENDKELYRIVRSIENMNYALETLQSDSGVTRPTLVEIHEEIRNLKKKILKKIDEGSVTLEDVISSAGNTKSFAFYLIQKGDTPEKIAGKKEVYGDPMLWPLIYRYNQSRLNQPDILTSSPLLIIYKNLPLAEKKDAIKKAAKFGHWDKWTKEDKRVLIEDWIM